jgi:hypothetical protein
MSFFRGELSALQPAWVVEVVAAVGGRNRGELQLPRPLLAWLQRDGPLHCGSIHTEHLLVLVPKIHHCFRLLPGVPHD